MLCMLEYDYLDRYGKDLFNDRIEVWHYGPVVPTVYYAYHTFVASNITTFKGSDTVTDDDRPFLDTLIARYGMMNLSLLIEESKHGADAHPFRNSPSPWTENTTT